MQVCFIVLIARSIMFGESHSELIIPIIWATELVGGQVPSCSTGADATDDLMELDCTASGIAFCLVSCHREEHMWCAYNSYCQGEQGFI